MSKQIIGVLALLCSSASMAGTLTVTSSNLNPGISDVFTVSLAATDINNVGGITLAVAWDSTKVALTGSSLPTLGDGPLAVGTGTFLVVNGAGNNRTLDILPGAPPISGNYSVAVLTFQALVSGAMNLIVNDDGGTFTGWFDNDTADVIPVNYAQANINVVGAQVPVPAAAWLLISALGSMVALKRRPL